MSNEGKIAVIIERIEAFPSRSMQAEGFAIETVANSENLLELIFADQFSGSTERVIINVFTLRIATDEFKRYVANFPIPTPSVDRARSLVRSPSYTLANHLVPSRLGDYAETIFDQFLIADWATHVRPKQKGEKSTPIKIKATPVLAVYSTLEMQVRFLYELMEKVEAKK